jgi:peroxiredoxin Q/BCP
MAKVAVGKPVPRFTAAATGETVVSTKDLLGHPFVLYFYPRDDTPGCTAEGQDFGAHYGKFKRRKVAVFGVSRDKMAAHDKFKAKYGFPFELIADPDEELCSLFDVVKDKNMYGKKVRGIERSTFLFDKDGILRREWRKVKVPGHVEEVLEAVKSL